MFSHKVEKIQSFFRSNKLTIALVGIAFLGGILGTFVLMVPKSNAGVVGDVFNGIKDKFESYLQQPKQQIEDKILNKIEEKKQEVVEKYEGIDSHEKSIIDSVEKASPAVVSIVISKDVPVIEQCPYNPFGDLPQEFQQFFGGGFEMYQPCQKGTQKQDVGGGSGFIVSKDGLIVTNKHVVTDEKAEYTVFTNDGKKYSASVLAKHPSLDLAIIKIKGSGLPVISLGNSNSIRLGQTAIAIGNALGEFRNTVSVGVVSGLSRSVTASDGKGSSEVIENVIQTDAPINPGNSGGPLINSRGEVIGINVAMVSGAQNIGFAIPINAAKKSIESVTNSGKISVAYMGVRYSMLNEDLSKKYNLSVSEGALLKGDEGNFAVETGSPADKAGLKEGDIIIYMDGVKLTKDKSLAFVISSKNPGDKVAIEYIRNGNKMTAVVVLGERK